MFIVLIHDQYNVLSKIEKRNTYNKAFKAAQFYTPKKIGWWYKIVETNNKDEEEMYDAMLNM